MAVGALGPWIRIGPYAGGVIERRSGGLLVLAAAIVAAALLAVWRRRRAAGFAALLAGLFGLAVTFHDRRHLTRFLPVIHMPSGLPFFDPRYVHAGWG